jgi:centrosomal CEP192-like protein
MTTSSQFQVDSGSTNCNQSTVLPPNASCQIGVVFSPSAEGQQSGSIVVSTIPASVSQTIPLQGNGHYNLVELPF